MARRALARGETVAGFCLGQQEGPVRMGASGGQGLSCGWYLSSGYLLRKFRDDNEGEVVRLEVVQFARGYCTLRFGS